jgi:hypothetical protein
MVMMAALAEGPWDYHSGGSDPRIMRILAGIRNTPVAGV